jgi:hypothetical protein
LDDNLIINIKCAKLLNHHIDSDFMLFMASLLIEDSHSLQTEQVGRNGDRPLSGCEHG